MDQSRPVDQAGLRFITVAAALEALLAGKAVQS
jgi:hypothetical protein